MKKLNCKNCGAVMVLDAAAMTANCRFCGTQYVMNREDTDYFDDYYAALVDLLSPDADREQRRKKADVLWNQAEEVLFRCTDGTDIAVRYMDLYVTDNVEVYVAKRSVVFHFNAEDAPKAQLFRKHSGMLDYPSTDTRHLEKLFPNVIGGFLLADGSSLLVISKDEEEYPLRLFAGLGGRHAAWIISRLENICCVLQYSGLVHPAILLEHVFINPYLHQASLYGGWWLAGRENRVSADGKTILRIGMSLCGIRRTAACVLGYSDVKTIRSDPALPKAMVDFVAGAPRENAYDDFEWWDKALISAYGKREFIRMDTNDEKIYGQGAL